MKPSERIEQILDEQQKGLDWPMAIMLYLDEQYALVQKKRFDPNVCGKIIQHTIMGPITCVNKLPCFLHDNPPKS